MHKSLGEDMEGGGTLQSSQRPGVLHLSLTIHHLHSVSVHVCALAIYCLVAGASTEVRRVRGPSLGLYEAFC